MKSFSARFEDLQALSVENLKDALDLERRLSRNLSRLEDRSPDHQLATEFKDHIRRTECYLARLEDLLRSAGPIRKAA